MESGRNVKFTLIDGGLLPARFENYMFSSCIQIEGPLAYLTRNGMAHKHGTHAEKSL